VLVKNVNGGLSMARIVLFGVCYDALCILPTNVRVVVNAVQHLSALVYCERVAEHVSFAEMLLCTVQGSCCFCAARLDRYRWCTRLANL